MINEYVIKLIDNLPDDLKSAKTPLRIDLVLDGGLFNGSYLVGAMYFLKEMEKRNYIIIERISSCSIGSVVAFLYYIDALDMMPQLYDIVNNEFKKYYKMPSIKDFKKNINHKIPEDICEKINGKLFICYNNVKKCVNNVKSQYKNVDEIMNTIIKSCYIPYLIDGDFLYEDKYLDGINPYFFNKEKDKKILFMNLYGYDKIFNLLNIKNENTNFHRILSGLLDIHSFFIKKTSTPMCSYVNEWNITDRCFLNLKSCIEKFTIYIAYLIMLIRKKIPIEVEQTFIYKLITKIFQDIFIVILETYCL